MPTSGHPRRARLQRGFVHTTRSPGGRLAATALACTRHSRFHASDAHRRPAVAGHAAAAVRGVAGTREHRLCHVQRPPRRGPLGAIDQQIGRGIDLSWADFLEPLDLPPLTADYVCTYARVMGQKDVTDFSIGIMAHQIMSFGNSILRRSLAPVYEIEGGPRALYDAIFADSTADLKLETPVTAIEQSANAVHVTTPDGGFTGRVCVVATPVTQWNRIVFDTPLSREKVEGSSMNLLNPANKIFALVKDAPINAAGFGNPEQSRGFVYTLPGKRVGEAQILMGMTYGGRVDATDREDVQRAFQAYFPGCEVLAVDSHDWNTDEFSQGAWIAPPPGYLSTYATSMRAPEGRLVFATGDISRHNLSSIAGAIESGTDAATFADAILEQAQHQRCRNRSAQPERGGLPMTEDRVESHATIPAPARVVWALLTEPEHLVAGSATPAHRWTCDREARSRSAGRKAERPAASSSGSNRSASSRGAGRRHTITAPGSSRCDLRDGRTAGRRRQLHPRRVLP